MEARGVSDILVVWDDEQQLDGADPGQLTPLGNEAGIRWWQGSLATLPAYQVWSACWAIPHVACSVCPP